jgi:hypothetical protein
MTTPKPETFEQRATRGLRERREYKIREEAGRISTNLGFLLRDLDEGRNPEIRGLLDNALAIAKAVAELDAMRELQEIHDLPPEEDRS